MPQYQTKEQQPSKNAYYLVNYNQFAAGLWVLVLFNTILISLLVGQPKMFYSTKNILIAVQTVAVIEIYNSLRGYVKSPLFTTVSQVASRLLIVWGVFFLLPNSPANTHWAYITLSLAWSITEIIRYFYYAQNIITKGNPPKLLTLLRYNLFFVLYPLGVFSELTLVYLSLDEAEKVVGVGYRYFFYAVFAVYVPGFYILFTHMIKQRKKALKALNSKAVEKREE